MRLARLKLKNESAVYHCITRVVAGEMLLHERSKEVLRRQIWQISDFCGVSVLTYAIMTNHAHLLIEVPKPSPVSDDELLRRFSVMYPRDNVRLEALSAALKEGGGEAARRRKQLLARMGDIFAFMKELKQRYTIWYNRNHGRFGTLWAERFKSILV